MGLASNVVAFPVSVPSTFDTAWGMRRGEMKTRGEGRDKTRKLWFREAVRVGGQDILLAALTRFLNEKKEVGGYTYPGLSVWLNQQRADHWLEESATGIPATGVMAQRFPEPYRSALVASCGEVWVKSYVDRFKLDGTVLVVSSPTAAARIREKGSAMKEAGLTALRLEPVKA